MIDVIDVMICCFNEIVEIIGLRGFEKVISCKIRLNKSEFTLCKAFQTQKILLLKNVR